jgi:glycosyltransferase involved in cell wall biosynthesis
MTPTPSRGRQAFVAPPPPAGDPERGPTPTFSVIVAAYQAADTIGEAVASALDQTAPPLEVIVCDDGSTDDLAGALAPLRDRIVLLRQERGGAGSARNRALRAASGEFVAPLDSDDAFLPGRLEALGRLAAARPDLDLVSTDVLFERDGEVVGRFYDENRFAVTDQRTAILGGCFVGWPAARRERLLAVGGFDESLATADDWAGWMRLILDGARAGLVPEPLLRYRLRPGSLSADRARSLRDRVLLLDKAARNPNLRAEERPALEAARRAAFARAAAEEAREALLESRPDARRRALAMAAASGVGARGRALAAGAALLPGAAGSLLRRRRRAASAGGDRAPGRRG